MELLNSLARFDDRSPQGRAVMQEALEVVVLMLSPVVPHAAHALWQALGHARAAVDEPWPVVDEAALVRETIEVVVQVNGKLRGRVAVAAEADEAPCVRRRSPTRTCSASSKVGRCASSSTSAASSPMSSSELVRGLSWPLVAILLSSCGFHLQGAVDLPVEVRRVYVVTADELTPFAVELREALTRNGATLAPAAGAADAIVRVRNDRTGRRVLSVSSRNTPVEFEVFYVVAYSIDRGQEEVVPSQTLELTRSFSFDEADLLAKDREEDILREAMARDLAGLVVRRLGSL